MSEIVQFPGRGTSPENRSGRELNDDGDRPHAEAFRDLEPEVCGLELMGDIAQDLIMQCTAREDGLRKLELAAFAVSQLAKMTRDFREIYYKRYYGELVRVS
jgi:hypothetical protein